MVVVRLTLRPDLPRLTYCILLGGSVVWIVCLRQRSRRESARCRGQGSACRKRRKRKRRHVLRRVGYDSIHEQTTLSLELVVCPFNKRILRHLWILRLSFTLASPDTIVRGGTDKLD